MYHHLIRDASGTLIDLEYVVQNAAASRINGLPRGRACAGMRVLEVFPGLAHDPLWEHYRRVADTGVTWSGEVHYRGEHIDHWFRMTAVRANAGIAVTFEDVSGRVSARDAHAALAEQLSASEARFRIAQEMSPDGFMMFRSVRTDGVIHDFAWAYTNPAAERMLGRSHADLLGKRLLVEMPGNAEEGLFDAYVAVVDTGEPFRHELTYGHEGLAHAFRILAVRLEDGFAVTFEDITRRTQTEAERDALLVTLRAAREEADAHRQRAETANRLKDEFLATISHELRTPLQAILGWSKVLRSGVTLTTERLHRGLEVIERNARAQAAIIEDILDVSRIMTGKLQLQLDDVDVVRVLDAAVDTLRPVAEDKGVDVHVSVSDAVGLVRADAARLQQVLWNLLGNAIKFTPSGGHVHITVQRVVGWLSIRVVDDGLGIEPGFLPHVFERFRQADGSATRAQGGLGLGLAIVRQLVDAHGGSVEVLSEGAGRGASFEVKLPQSAADSSRIAGDRAAPPTSTAASDAAAIDLSGVRIVIVDDQDDARDVAALILSEAGAQVRAVASAEAALACVRAEPPDLLVADLAMPGQDGHSLVRELRALPGPERSVPAVALTASTTASDRARALQTGFDDFLAKPATPYALLSLARRLVKNVGR